MAGGLKRKGRKMIKKINKEELKKLIEQKDDNDENYNNKEITHKLKDAIQKLGHKTTIKTYKNDKSAHKTFAIFINGGRGIPGGFLLTIWGPQIRLIRNWDNGQEIDIKTRRQLQNIILRTLGEGWFDVESGADIAFYQEGDK